MGQQRKARSALVLIALVAVAVVAVGCGGDDEGGGSGSSAAEVDKAFVRLMIPHHESAIEMAEIAQKRGQHKEVKELADAIVKTQNAEIEELKSISEAIGADAGGSSSGGHDMEAMDSGGQSMTSDDLATLGLSEDEGGMAMHMSMVELESAKPFDRAFIEMMVAHHEGAVEMAEAQLAKGENAELNSIAEKIVDAQKKEIDDMTKWYADWYGGPIPGAS